MYNKLFTKILDSSIWLEPTPTRIVWLTIIAAMDEEGMVQFASTANLAHRARVTLEEAEDAIRVLEGPDANSADPANDGRRLERVPGGWVVLNAAKYRGMVNRVMVQEQTRERVRRYRERHNKTENRSEPPPEKDTYSPSSRAALVFLNERSGKSFRESATSLDPINARLKEPGVTIDGVKQMIERQCLLWRDDPKMSEFLRPSTLFRPTNFNEYYAAKDLPIKPNGTHQRTSGKPQAVLEPDYSKGF